MNYIDYNSNHNNHGDYDNDNNKSEYNYNGNGDKNNGYTRSAQLYQLLSRTTVSWTLDSECVKKRQIPVCRKASEKSFKCDTTLRDLHEKRK